MTELAWPVLVAPSGAELTGPLAGQQVLPEHGPGGMGWQGFKLVDMGHYLLFLVKELVT